MDHMLDGNLLLELMSEFDGEGKIESHSSFYAD